jgi:hypothetical protein
LYLIWLIILDNFLFSFVKWLIIGTNGVLFAITSLHDNSDLVKCSLSLLFTYTLDWYVKCSNKSPTRVNIFCSKSFWTCVMFPNLWNFSYRFYNRLFYSQKRVINYFQSYWILYLRLISQGIVHGKWSFPLLWISYHLILYRRTSIRHILVRGRFFNVILIAFSRFDFISGHFFKIFFW